MNMKLLIEADDVDGILKEKLVEVSDPKSKLPVLREMVEIMEANNGIGITANQVGLLDRMFVYTLNKRPEFAINPIILKLSKRQVTLKEGCLSYPGAEAQVMRPAEIKVKYHNGHVEVIKNLKGMEARCFLHEYGHCEGHCILSDN
jgi:peptide deformylase